MVDFQNSPHIAEIDYLKPKIAATRSVGHKFAKITLGLIGSFVVVFIIWASFARITVITHGHGRVIPSQKTQIISHLEGGIIKDVLVKEGDLVNAGQVLIRLDPQVAEAREKASREQYLRYLASAERLQAQLDENKYIVPDVVMKESPLIANEELKHYQERISQVETQKSIAEEVVIQKRQELEEEKAKLAQSEAQFALSKKELNMVAPLVKEKLISEREILRLQRDTANLEGEVAKSKASLPKLEAALEQAKREHEQVILRFQNEDQDALRELKIKLAEEQDRMVESKDRMVRTEIRAPLKGIVKDIKIKTEGSVIRAGDAIMEIVPFDDSLIVEAMVAPTDVAFLHPNQEANIKVTAYDSTIYGSLKGKLIAISPDTVHDIDEKKDFYRIRLVTDKNFLTYQGKNLPIIPGMTVESDILTGDRTVMQYIFKPLVRGWESAFTNR